MRILIVEDEPVIREGLIHIIREGTLHEIAGIAENGNEGYEKAVALKPDLVVTDIRMPEEDGLSMLSRLKEEGEEVKAMILTGYSEFEYARKAVSLRVVEYILKPVDVESFLQALEGIDGAIERKKNLTASAVQLLWSCLTGTQEERERLLPVLGRSLHVNARMESTLFLVRPSSIAVETVTGMMEETREILDSLCITNYYLLFLAADQGFLVVITDTERNHFLKQTFEKQVMKRLEQESECFCTVLSMKGVKDLNRQVERLKSMMAAAFSLPGGTVLDEAAVEEKPYLEVEYPLYLERRTCRDLRSGAMERVLEESKSFEALIIDGGLSPEQIREYTMRFASGMIRAAGQLRESLWHMQDAGCVVGGMAGSRSKEELRRQLQKVIKAVTRQEAEKAVTDNGMVLNAIVFIRENYKREVSLGEIAEACGVTPEYLSTLFCREMDVNFTAFLQNFRISMAKRMLALGNRRIGQIAEEVGFRDQKYFVKVFKKICGVTPSEYKKEVRNP